MTTNRGLRQHNEWQERVEPLRDVILWLYVRGDLTQAECAEMFGVTQGMFSRWVKMLGFRHKTKAAHQGLMAVYVERVCSDCGGAQDLRIHYRDGNTANNALSNLDVLCSGCHTKLHKGEVGAADVA